MNVPLLHLVSGDGRGCDSRIPAPYCLGVRGRGSCRGPDWERCKVEGDGGDGAGNEGRRRGRGGRGRGGMACSVIPTKTRVPQSPETNYFLKRLSRRSSAGTPEEAGGACEVMQAGKQTKRVEKRRLRTEHKNAQLEVRVMGFVRWTPRTWVPNRRTLHAFLFSPRPSLLWDSS